MGAENTKRVLVIDDDLDFCHLMLKILSNYGFSAEYVLTLRDSETRLASQPAPDVILLDYGMPDGTGLSFFQSHPDLFANHEVILISADPSEVLGKEIKKAGIVHFLPKPVALGTLLSMIRQTA